MILATPPIKKEQRARLTALDELRKKLGEDVATSSPWLGTLRREVKASSIESSVSIEGFEVSHEEAIALVNDGDTAGDEENRLAVACYARAMDHVGVMATDPVFRWLDRVILDLHFDACYFQRDKSPGHWRTGSIVVTGPGGGLAYEGPEGGEVPGLMAEVVEWLDGEDPKAHPVVRAAMAHLHIVAVHPFRDGNGRVARIVQSLVLAREHLVSPEFGSIEEYLAAHTSDYYTVLQEVQGGSYRPDRDASAWIDFCLEAHLAQAKKRLAQIEEAAKRWGIFEQLVESRGWPDRLVIALEQSLIGGSDRLSYSNESGISASTASADFRRLQDAGLVERQGKGPGSHYLASDNLRSLVGA